MFYIYILRSVLYHKQMKKVPHLLKNVDYQIELQR